jgi:hypothetical protein
MSGLTRFLGDTPLRVILRLVVLSFLVGLALSALNIHPIEIYWWLERLARHAYETGFAFLGDAVSYLVLGALVVVPIFLLVRLLKFGGHRPGRTDMSRRDLPP